MEAHGRKYRASAKLVDMGLGKTAVELTVIARRIKYLLSKGTLVIAPLKVIQETWPDEVRKWDHTKHLRVSIVHGNDAVKLVALHRPADIYLINYENMIWLTDWMLTQESLPFDSFVFDESSKMKSHSSKRFKLFKPHIARFRYRSILTGTPAPNSYADLWAQFYLLDEGERLGKFYTHFMDRFFKMDIFNGIPQYHIRGPKAKAEIERRVADISLSLQSSDHITLPDLIVNDILVELPPKHRQQYEEFEREMFVALDGGPMEALNGAARSSKCSQFVSGAVYEEWPLDELGNKIGKHKWLPIHNAKLDALEDIIEEANGNPILLAYDYRHDLERIQKRFKQVQVMKGDWKERWNRGEIPVLAVHPASAGHGLNLQHGGHILVWFTLTWNLEYYQQLNKRLHRSGQSHPVIVHRLITPRTVDVVKVSRLESKDKSQAGLLKALREYKRRK